MRRYGCVRARLDPDQSGSDFSGDKARVLGMRMAGAGAILSTRRRASPTQNIAIHRADGVFASASRRFACAVPPPGK
jgi:hypothetical protein